MDKMLIGRESPRYKPVILRLPSLVVFLSLFALSIGLIERLLRPSPKLSESAVSSRGLSEVIKRQDSTSTSTIWCDDAVTYSSKLSSLESRYDDICTEFSNLFNWAEYSATLSRRCEVSSSSSRMSVGNRNGTIACEANSRCNTL